MKSESKKITFMSYAAIAVVVLLIMRLLQLQILHGSDYRKLSEANRFRIMAIPAPRGILFDRNGIPLVKNSPYFCASIIYGEFDKSKVPELSQLLNVPAEALYQKLNGKRLGLFTPIRIKQGLTPAEVAYIESRRSNFPGLTIEVDVSREYLYNSLGSHLIGYIGKLNPAQIKDPAFSGVPPDTFVGQWGVEMFYDNSLRGIYGERVIEVDALGRELRLLREKQPIKGNDIELSIHINVQGEAERALGERTGAIVAMNPHTGEILAFVSKPSFDPNLFSKGIGYQDWLHLMRNKYKPFLNRALQSQYPPGSTFKIIMAIAGLEEGVITPETKVDCKGGINYGKWHFGCWRKNGHGVVSLHRALVESCDVYFYEVGRRLGIEKIFAYATRLGFGKETGCELAKEKQGLMPNTKWKQEKRKQPWYLGETFNTAIGQGYVSVTPIQMAVMMSAVANGGDIYKPTMIKNTEPVITGKANVSPETLKIVRKGLSGVVNEPSGTGWAAKSQLTEIGGKTGTAQVAATKGDSRYLPERFRDHAWFVAFAPVEDPEIAVVVFVEHGGHGGGAAAPIAKRVIEEYLKNSTLNQVQGEIRNSKLGIQNATYRPQTD